MVGHDPKIFSGQYFVAFAASDAQSGIDHYEVLEVPAGWQVVLAGGTFEPEPPEHVVKVRNPIVSAACETVCKEIMASSAGV